MCTVVGMSQEESVPDQGIRGIFTVDGTVYMQLMGHLRAYLVRLYPFV